MAGSERASTDRRSTLLLAVLAYVPIIFTRPGWVSADTKVYLSLDPGRLLERAWSMWDAWTGAGSVPHQNIGYLFPLGPLYWLSDAAGLPMWLLQRLIWGTIVFAAGLGAHRLVRSLGFGAPAALVAALAYGWSPYLLVYLARLSVILLPWAALPWLVLLAAQAVRSQRWAAPARFALVVALVGSVNATSLVLVGLGPVLWVLVEVLTGRQSVRASVAAGARTLLLTAGVSLWWILALRLQGRYGLPILRFTETYQTVAGASTPPEIMRGLGYWFAYGGDRLGPWVEGTQWYVHPAMIAVSSIVVAAALVGLTIRAPGVGRGVVLVVVGLAVAVGAAPLGASNPYGSWFERFATDTTAGLALRSTPRAAPLVLLGLAIGLASFTAWSIDRVAQSRPRRASAMVTTALGTLLVVQLLPWFTGNALTESILRPSSLPADQQDLGRWLERPDGPDGRIWELPGADFAAYRWGGTVDPILPGVTERSVLHRSRQPTGGEATVDLVAALDRRLHEGTADLAALRPIAGRFGIDTVVSRHDLEHERFRLVRPGELWHALSAELGAPDHAGPLISDEPAIPMLDEIAIAADAAGLRAESFPSVAAWDIADDAPLVTAYTAPPMVVAGDADGLVDLAEAGLLAPDRPVLFARTVTRLPADELDPALHAGGDPSLVVTDSNRRAGRRWSTLGVNRGVLETAGETSLVADPSDQRLVVVADETDDERTVAALTPPLALVRASSYGNQIAYTPEDGPLSAIDGDPRTAWRTGVFSDVRGEFIEIEFERPISADHLVLLQPTTLVTTRYLTSVRIELDDHTNLEVALDERSRMEPGQRIEFEPVRFSRLRITMTDDNLGPLSSYSGQPGAGLAEVTIPGIAPDSVVQMPTEWLDEVPGLDDAPLTLVMTRSRLDPAILNRADPEPILDRSFTLPSSRAFSISGTARVESTATDATIAAALGVAAAATSDQRLIGSPVSWAPSAIDGSSQTAWTVDFDQQDPARLRIDLGGERDLGRLIITALDIPERSVPTAYSVVLDADGPGAGTSVPIVATGGHAEVDLSGERASTVDVLVTDVAARQTAEYFSGTLRRLPFSITEVEVLDPSGVDLAMAPLAGSLPPDCRDDLISIDGTPVPVRLVGALSDAVRRVPLGIESCGPPLVLAAGAHRLTTTAGLVTGMSVDRVVLDSEDPTPVADTTSEAPHVEVADIERSGPTIVTGELPPRETPTWVVLRESWNEGWELTIDGEMIDGPVLIDGYAAGWLVPPSDTADTLRFEWQPQGQITLGFVVSGATFVVAGILALRRRPRNRPIDDDRTAPRFAGLPHPDRIAPVLSTLALAVAGGVIGAATYVLMRLLRPRAPAWFPAAVAVALWGIGALYIAALQFGYDYPADPDWPSRFSVVSPLTWAAIAAVVAAVDWQPQQEAEVAPAEMSH